MGERGSAATTRLRKAECPACGYIVRVSRKWLAMGLPTCACGATMESADYWAELEAELREEHELAEWQAKDARAAQRNRGALPAATRGDGYRDAVQCQGCRRFVAHKMAVCGSCGHVQDHSTGPGHHAPARTRVAAMPF